MNNLQFEINFAPQKENHFRETLDQGGFVLLIEHNSAGRDNDLEAAKERLRQLESAVLDIKSLNCALAITDAYSQQDSYRSLDYAMGLNMATRDRHIIYLSGRNTDLESGRELVQFAKAGNFPNLVAVTGDAATGEGVRDTRKRNFLESVHSLHLMNDGNFFQGCVMNPFQYTPYSLYPQYSKLVKKLNSGAKFIVTQAGYDMLKLQALRWYLGERGLYFPTIARLLLLTQEKLEGILDKRYPGIKISSDFRKILDKESQFSSNQFESAQWRRLELQAAGCRLLGYSGIQVMGVDSPAKARIAAERVAGALREFTSFEQWLEEYNAYLAKAEMAPLSPSFYMYDRILHRSYPETPPLMSEIGELKISRNEKFLYKLRKFFFAHSDTQSARNRHFWKVLLAGCRSCSQCRLPSTFYVCPEHCPKKLANGPCGGVKTNGDCELGNFECIHSYKMRLALWQKKMDKLEDVYIPPIDGI
ncbi:MAG: methylenetetrahydrofolate reductase C-terminal domain-containing protein [Lentisphaeria bacterium]|nr:methylenetetrahydrofolate reductase C-terminal domain-containing protein [Lentisphaeria bacterium]